MSKSHPLRAAVVVTTAAAMLLTGCAPGGGPQNKADREIVTDPSQIPETTLTVLDPFVSKDLPSTKWFLEVQDAFMDLYPQITIKRETQSYDDIASTLRLRLSGTSVPDVVPPNQGWQGLGTLGGENGLLVNLDEYAEAYGWNEDLPDTVLAQHRVAQDGRTIGEGSLYGMPVNQGAIQMVHYNKRLLSDLGLEVPETFSEFQDVLAASKAAGQVPIAFSVQSGGGIAALLQLQNVLGGPADIRDFVFSSSDIALDETGMPEAAATYQEWLTEGYFSTDAAGISPAEAMQRFVDGEALFLFFGTEGLPFADGQDLSDFGAFVLPRDDDTPVGATGSSLQNFSIASHAKNPDAAALFLDFLATEEVGELALKYGIMPMFGSYDPSSIPASLEEEYRSLETVNASDGYIPYFDWATPTMLDTLRQSVDELAAARIDAQEFVDRVQRNQAEFHATREDE